MLKQLFEKYMTGMMKRRCFMAFFGVITCGASVALFKQAAFGVDPFQCFCGGLDRVIPIGFGTLYMLINLILLVVTFFLDKHYIGVTTFLNLFFLGYLIEYAEKGLCALMGAPSMALRIVYITLGIVIMCISSSLYYEADLGVSTYDSMALYISATSKLPFRYVRIGTDLICCGIGFAFGEVPGIGTLITAFCMGPLISFFRRTIAIPMMNRPLKPR